MADSRSSAFPWASVAVLVAFVASTQLVPHAFEALRPPEKERAQASVEAELPIDARLWEDPFTALRRYEIERNERCDKRFKTAEALDACKGADLSRNLPANILRRLGGIAAPEQTLVLTALVPGNPFVGAEESRRRTRYAMLAGLQATGFVPDDAEHMGLLALQRQQLTSNEAQRKAAASSAGGVFNVPYELLRYSPARELLHRQPELKRYQRVLLLWVDESALPQPKLDALALMMTQLFGEWACQSAGKPGMPGLAVIGPSSTDALRVALADLDRAGDTARGYGHITPEGKCLAAAPTEPTKPTRLRVPNDLEQGYWRLAHAHFYSAASTAPARFLPELGAQRDINDFLTQQFAQVTDPVYGPRPGEKVSFVRTIATDAQLLHKLRVELSLRLPSDKPRRVVLVAERDSVYAQALLRELARMLGERMPQLQLEPVYYFRGLDGVTTRDTAGTADKAAGKGQDDPTRIEWPEARDQLDYLRRMGQSLYQSESDPHQLPIGAIGVLGFDVHDKLLVMQALHERFADRIFFTTDMDARLLHPRALPFTRNLIVASSLPLEMPRAQHEEDLDLRAGGAPFRDVYQSSTYLAARQAACLDADCLKIEGAAAGDLLKRPRLYEIGRTRAVGLEGRGKVLQVGRAEQGQGLVAGLLLGAVFLGLLLWPSTPALRKLRTRLVRFDPDDTEAAEPVSRFAALLATAHLAVLAYMYVSVLEFLKPDSIGPWQIGLLGVAVLLPAALALLPVFEKRRRMNGGLYHLLVLSLALGLVMLVWRQQETVLGCVDCEPIAWFEGVSAWPSHLLHLLALVVTVASIDLAWEHGLHTLAEDGAWLGLSRTPSQLRRRSGWAACLPRISVLRWSRPPGYSCEVKSLWNEYLLRGGGRPRALRTVLAYVLTMLITIGLFWALGTGESGWGDSRIFEVPVRGERHRHMVLVAFGLILLLLPLAILAVSDATLLALRFVRHLNRGRSVYPQGCLERFAASLGDSTRAALWSQRLVAEPELRGTGLSQPCHSLLDDWIDMQLVARRTEHIAPLVMGPFIVLGIVLLARSRLFDNWSLTPAIALAASAYLLALIALSALLKNAVEKTRSHALSHMAADLRWLKGQPAPLGDLAKPFESLMDEVRQMRSGAFAGVFEQPLLKAMLVPLGGAGGAQLLDYFSLVY